MAMIAYDSRKVRPANVEFNADCNASYAAKVICLCPESATAPRTMQPASLEAKPASQLIISVTASEEPCVSKFLLSIASKVSGSTTRKLKPRQPGPFIG